MATDNHEEVFINSYARLRGWAARIARPDRQLAEDLLHDAFIQFTNTRPNLDNIVNPEAYLYGVIRNLHLSHLRKKGRREQYFTSIIDFETLRRGLKSTRFADNFQTQEELQRICYFLSLRKESSKSASVMILRFFHGYFPGEIAEVLRVGPQVVKVRLNTARNEIKTVLGDNSAIQALERKMPPESIVNKHFQSKSDLTVGLGEIIFRSTRGNCPGREWLRETYGKPEPIETPVLAHLVSCRKCLDEVNSLLNIPLISERYAVDFIGKDGGGDSGPDDQSGKGGMSKDVNEKLLNGLRRSSREVFEHEPQELFISVNGDVIDSKKIETVLTELTVETFEPLEFVELFSEQDVRLAFLSFSEPTAQASDRESFEFQLSDERAFSIELKKEALSFVIRTRFADPHFEERKLLAESLTEEMSLAEFMREKTAPVPETKLFGGLLESRSAISLAERLKGLFNPSNFGLRTAFTGAALILLAVTALFVGRFFLSDRPASAPDLVQKTAQAEQLFENDPVRILYRTLNFEERNSRGEIVKKQRIEIFSDAGQKLSVRRIFDANGRLQAGEWRRKDGVSTIYSTGKASELRLTPTDKDLIVKDPENVWQMSVSARGFLSMVESPADLTVEEHENEYLVNYAPKNVGQITSAVLTVGKDWRTRKLTLSVKQNDTLREFSFTEAVFEQKPRESIDKKVFEPDSEFVKNTSSATKTSAEIKTEDQILPESATAENSSAKVSSALVTPELELKVLQLLNDINALSGEQIGITKTADGRLLVKGVVDSKKRKDQILGVLAEVRNHPAVSISILTAEEASRSKSSKNSDVPTETISVESQNSIPAGELLRNYFSAQNVPNERLEAEIRRFAAGVLAKSAQTRRAALQMKQIAERFSTAELEKMDDAAKNNWRRLIKQNAANLAQNAENLRSDLKKALNIGVGTSSGGVNSANDAELVKAARRLFELSVAVDRDVRASFTSGGGRGTVSVKSSDFAGNLAEIIGLAGQLR